MVWVFGHFLCALLPVLGPWGCDEEAGLSDSVDAVVWVELFPRVRAGVVSDERGKTQAGLFLWGEKCEQVTDQTLSSSIWQCSPIQNLAGVWWADKANGDSQGSRYLRKNLPVL